MKLRQILTGVGLALAMSSAQAIVVDFEGLDAGTIIDGAQDGVTITTDGFSGSSPDVAVVFDTANPTGGDEDLGGPFSTSNPDLSSEYDPGNVLIIQENGPCEVICETPDDDRNGGTIKFVFDQPITLNSIDVFDIEADENSGEVELYVFTLDADGDLLGAFTIPVTGGDNTWDRVTFDNADNVGTVGIFLAGSGAIDNIDFTVVPVPPAVLLFGSALGLLAGVRRRLAAK